MYLLPTTYCLLKSNASSIVFRKPMAALIYLWSSLPIISITTLCGVLTTARWSVKQFMYIISFVLLTSPWSKYYNSHIIDEEPEDQRTLGTYSKSWKVLLWAERLIFSSPLKEIEKSAWKWWSVTRTWFVWPKGQLQFSSKLILL